MTFLKNFIQDEQGQDLVEYTLLLAFIALAIGALYTAMGDSILGIWTKANTDLVAANTAAH
jgi:Flp pilus assembly pilin Flp